MTIQEIEQKLNECQKALAELKESKKEGKWKPAYKEKYWIRDDGGEIGFDNWTDHEIDVWRYNNLPMFKTKEQCERYWHFMDTVKEKSYQFSKEEMEKQQPKYCIYYDYRDEHFGINDTFNYKYFGEIYFKTEEDAQYIIDNFKDELMEYWI
jgi:hypothetical protein